MSIPNKAQKYGDKAVIEPARVIEERKKIGLQFSRIEYTGSKAVIQDGETGLAFGLGLGAIFFTGDKIFINAAYNFTFFIQQLLPGGHDSFVKGRYRFSELLTSFEKDSYRMKIVYNSCNS